MWCLRRMGNISWADHVRKEEVLRIIVDERNVLHAVNRRKTNWIGHMLRRNVRLKDVIEGKIKG
jgi:hypothetical protein